MRSGARHGVAIALILVLSATGCSLLGDDPAPAARAPEVMTESQLREATESVVAEREAALLSGDRDAFLSTIDEDALQFVATQERWFDNISSMPISHLSLTVVDEDHPDDKEASPLRVPVDFTMRLAGFEDTSVTQRLVYTFTRGVDGLVLAADRDARADERGDWLPEPWDITQVVVRHSDAMLVFFDEDTSPYADAVMKDLEASRRSVMAALPDWSGKLVAYDISDLSNIEKRSPMSLAETGGVAYP
ncbi:MAG: hypothetical protein H0U61_11140, partial [Nocardioidaceae bacterium]|nr:hypothetical protein [Nocardioidaceae bacterium]